MSRLVQLKVRIKKNEGYRNHIYCDQLGKPTIGFGHLIKKNEKFLHKKKYSKEYLNIIFENDFNLALKDFRKWHQAKRLPINLQGVLIEMVFQLGIKNCLKFKKFNRYLKKKLFYMASLEMLDSLWYVQTPKRVEKLISLLLEYKNDK